MLSAIEEVGVIQDVIVNQRTGKLLDGHLRLELALSEGQEEIPVKYVDLSEAEEALVLATFDPVGSLAFLDLEEMSQLQSELTPNLDRPLADLIDSLAPAPLPEADTPEKPLNGDQSAEASAPNTDPNTDSDSPEEPLQYILATPRRLIHMTHEENVRLSEAFEAYLESRGMSFGFVRWLCA